MKSCFERIRSCVILAAVFAGIPCHLGMAQNAPISRAETIAAIQAGSDSIPKRYADIAVGIPSFQGIFEQDWILISSRIAHRKDVRTEVLGLKNLDSVFEVQKKIHAYAKKQGFASGYWSGHQGLDKDKKRVLGVFFIDEEACKVMEVDLPDLEKSQDWPIVMVEATARLKLAHPEMAGAFPSGFRKGNSYGVVFLKEQFAVRVSD